MDNKMTVRASGVVVTDSDSEWEDVPERKPAPKARRAPHARTSGAAQAASVGQGTASRSRTTSPQATLQPQEAALTRHRHDMFEVRQNPGMQAWNAAAGDGGFYVGLDAPTTVRQCRTCGQYEGQILFQEGMAGVADIVGEIFEGVKGLFKGAEKK